MENVFSENEQVVLKILGRRKMKISAVTEKFCDTSVGKFDANNYVASVIRRIKKKCMFYDKPWTIDGSGGGRGGRLVWKTKRRTRRKAK